MKAVHALFLIVCFSGCRGVGPGSIESDRRDYGASIAESWNQQMLLNRVKLRYAAPPVFLEVASVIGQYSHLHALNGPTVGTGG